MALAMIEAAVISALERPCLLAKDCRSPPPRILNRRARQGSQLYLEQWPRFRPSLNEI